jgi:hypothetical protein
MLIIRAFEDDRHSDYQESELDTLFSRIYELSPASECIWRRHGPSIHGIFGRVKNISRHYSCLARYAHYRTTRHALCYRTCTIPLPIFPLSRHHEQSGNALSPLLVAATGTAAYSRTRTSLLATAAPNGLFTSIRCVCFDSHRQNAFEQVFAFICFSFLFRLSIFGFE